MLLGLALFKFRDDRPLLAADQSLTVCAIAGIEAGGAGSVLVHGFFSVRRGGLEVSILKKEHDHVFIVKVHGRGDVGLPGVIPHDDAVIFQQLL